MLAGAANDWNPPGLRAPAQGQQEWRLRSERQDCPQSGLLELFGSGRFGPGSSAKRKRKSGL